MSRSRDIATRQPKYVRYIVVQVSETGSLELLAHHLPARPVSTDVVVACKVAGLTLKVLQMVRTQAADGLQRTRATIILTVPAVA